MAGYASQADYESELLQTYLRSGRVSPITKRDVDLALSIYRMPKGKTNYKDLAKLTAATAKAAVKGKDDAGIMQLATVAVLNKALDTRRQAAAAKAEQAKTDAISRTAARSVAPAAPARRVAAPVPAYSGPLTPTRPKAVSYSGPLTPSIAPRTTTTKTATTTRKPRTGYTIR